MKEREERDRKIYIYIYIEREREQQKETLNRKKTKEVVLWGKWGREPILRIVGCLRPENIDSGTLISENNGNLVGTELPHIHA